MEQQCISMDLDLSSGIVDRRFAWSGEQPFGATAAKDDCFSYHRLAAARQLPDKPQKLLRLLHTRRT